MAQAQDPAGEQPDARRPLSGPAAGPGAARIEGLDALLREIDGLRTTLQTDLSLAAGALEMGAAEVAGSLLDADRCEVSDFEGRALEHLRRLEADDRLARASGDVVVPFVPRAAVARRRRRLARLLPATPLVAAAAAIGVLLGAVPGGSSRPPASDASGAVLSSWEELTRLAADDAPAEDVHRAALDLNADIASMVARAGGDPAAARQALALLREAQVVLANDDDAAELLDALSQSRALAARLLASLPASALETLPSPVRSALADPLTAPRPSARTAERPQRSTDAPRPARSSGSASSPSPGSTSASTASTPGSASAPASPGARPTPSPEPVRSSSPSPSATTSAKPSLPVPLSAEAL